MNMICDYYINNEKTYIHFLPQFVYKLQGIRVTDKNHMNIAYKLLKNNAYNIVFYIYVPFSIKHIFIYVQDTIIELFPKEVPQHTCVLLQSCIFMKDEYELIYKFVEYHKKYHNVQRFIVFDNNSEKKDEKQKFVDYVRQNSESIIYIEFNHPYSIEITDKHEIKNNNNCNRMIVAQNTAYSIALKKFNAKYTMLTDLDEYIARDICLNDYLADKTESYIIHGIWTGCNQIKDQYEFSPEKIRYISNEKCNQKLILRNECNDYTVCIHHPQYKNKTKILPVIFLHMRSLSLKKRNCNCELYCSIPYKLVN